MCRRASILVLSLAIFAPALAQPTTAPAVMRYEAEDARLVGGATRATTRPAYSGGGYVTGINKDGDGVAFDVVAPRPGLYDLTIRYCSPRGHKGYYLTVAGIKTYGMFRATAEAFVTHPAGRVELAAGANAILLEKYWGYHDIDYIDLAPAGPAALRPPTKPPKTLCDPQATPEARALHALLIDRYGEGVLSGVYSTRDADHVSQTTGKLPAIMAGDLMDYSPSRAQRGARDPGEVDRLIRAAGQGHLVSLSWHWNAPAGLLDRVDTDRAGNRLDRRWYKGFNADATNFDLARAMADARSEEHQLLLRDIDVIAGQLRKLADARVPVLWRPVHEAEARSFWWGARGPEPFVQLWRLMHERLTGHHGLHNLIWVYTSAGQREWYPGDAYVDVLGVDVYSPDTRDPLSELWQILSEQHAGRKLLAVTEFGGVPDVERMRRHGAHWSYFVSWTGPAGPRKMTDDQLRSIYASPAVVNRDAVAASP